MSQGGTHVVILAQGDQKRIPELKMPKQLLRLPWCNGEPILNRTIRQLLTIDEPIGNIDRITVVGWPIFIDHFGIHPVQASKLSRPFVVTLDRPGNSSLKGAAEYLKHHQAFCDRVVILLGDVVYSWKCLEALLSYERDLVVATSADLSPSTGELWGLAWNKWPRPEMEIALHQALDKHPQQTIYQPGQMRLWLYEIEKLFVSRFKSIRYVTNDYTTDIDLPQHTTDEFLGKLSLMAGRDDTDHEVSW